MKKFKNFMLVLLLMCFATAAWSADFYVDRLVGIDAPGRGSVLLPYHTIQYAVDNVVSGSTLLIYQGIYDENVSVPSGKIINFKGNYNPVYLGSGYTLTLASDVTFDAFYPQSSSTGIIINSGGKIQDGIDFAIAGSTVNVGTGTFTEQLLIQKDLILAGAGSTNTTIKAPAGRTLTAPGFSAGADFQADFILAAYPTTILTDRTATISVKVSGIKFDADDNPMVNGGRYPAVFFRNVYNTNIGDAGLFNCIVEGFKSTDTETAGIWAEDKCKLTIDGNTFSDYTEFGTNVYGMEAPTPPVVTTSNNTYTAEPQHGFAAILYWFTTTGTIDHNTITGGENGIQINAATNTTVTNNTISGCNYTGFGHSISDVDAGNAGWALVFYEGANNNTATGNEITTSDVAIENWNSTGNVVNNNSIHGNYFGLHNSITTDIDGTHNYWGGDKGPYHATLNPCGNGDQISLYVTFEPWHTVALVDASRVPAPTGTSPQIFCTGDAKLISDLEDYVTGDNIKWYNAATGGTEYTDPTASLVTTTYYASQTVDGCESLTRFALSVTVNATPSAPSASPQSFCSAASHTVADLAPSGTQYNWYNVSTGGTPLSGTTVLSTGTYYVSEVLGSCEGPRTSVAVTVNTTPSAPTGTASQSFCSGALPTVSNLAATGTTIKWYAVATGGTALLTSTPLTTATHYFASQTSAEGCESTDRFDVLVTINTTPGAPTGTASQTFCSSENPKVADLEATGTTIQWYHDASGGTALAGTVALENGHHYYASQTSAESCESTARFDVTVTINTTPGAPEGSATQSFCSGSNPTVANLVATGTTIKWYAAATDGTALPTSTALTTATHYYASQTSAQGCESTARLDVLVTVNTTPSAPTGTAAQSFCSGALPTVANLAATGTSIQWYIAGTGGSPLSPTTALVNGNHYYASQTSAQGCESTDRFDVTATVNTTPGAPTGTAAQSFCSGDNPTVNDLEATGTTIQWYHDATGGTALAGTVALENGHHYYASQTSAEGCESTSRFDVTATINTTPGAPTTTDDTQDFCAIDANTVSDLTPFVTGTTIKWYSASSGGTAYTGTELLATGSYWASQTSAEGCESTTRLEMEVTVNDPQAPTADAQSFCFVNRNDVGDLSATGDNLKWYDVATGGTALLTTEILETAHYWVSQTVGGCESPRTEVAVTVTTSDPGAPSAQNTSLTATNIRADRATIGWTRANLNGGTGSLVVASTIPITEYEVPAGCNDAGYSYNSIFTSAPFINGSTTARIVYIGTAKLFNLTGLTKLNTYYLKVFAYNGTYPNRLYNTTIGTNTKNFRTPLRKEGAEGTDALSGTFSMGLISPNPVTDAVNFTLDVPQDDSYSIEIYDLDGKVVKSYCQNQTYSPGIHNIYIGTNNLSSGVYTLVVKTGVDMAITQFVITK